MTKESSILRIVSLLKKLVVTKNLNKYMNRNTLMKKKETNEKKEMLIYKIDNIENTGTEKDAEIDHLIVEKTLLKFTTREGNTKL